GTYYLVETNTPAGFNTAEPVTVVIGENGAITANTENVTEVKILNVSGNVLPETGGIGTTIFYALGAVMVIGAGVLLIAKKRMSNEG
ncbi:MAG: LPXTG cell wall anchor domain-containing protein, partial [Clostridia bacterium]|nr:LPXTG cell wall anchor domain-containing protein [Clostridia bacterium]